MFDLRYHVASLAAVFLALIIGILVGVGHLGEGVRLRQRAVAFQPADRRSEEPARLGDEAGHRPRAGPARRAELRPGRLPVADGQPALRVEGRPRLRGAGRRPGALARGGDARRRGRPAAAAGDGAQAPDRPARPCAKRSPSVPRSPRSQRNDASATSAGGSAAISCSAATAPRGRRCRRPSSRSRRATTPRRSTRVIVNRSTAPQSGVTARFLAGFYAGLGAPGRARRWAPR